MRTVPLLLLHLSSLIVFTSAGSANAPDAHAHDAHAHHAAVAYSRSEHLYKIPPLALVDIAGQPVDLSTLLATDKPVLLNFIFTSCSAICPVMAATFTQVQQRLGPDHDRVRLISVSIDPQYDTPQRLKAYAKRFNAQPDWHFLTGDPTAIRRVQDAFDAYRGGKSNHLPLTMLRTAPGSSWIRIEGLASPDQLLHELERRG